MSDLISRSTAMENYCNALCPKLQKGEYCNDCIVKAWLNNQPTAYSVDKVVEKLKERTDFLKGCTKYGNKNAEQQAESYSTMMMYEVADLVDDLIEIVKQGCVADDVCGSIADKIKVTSLEVIVTGKREKPYYEIKYKEVGEIDYKIGYSSYDLNNVFAWKDEFFEIVNHK